MQNIHKFVCYFVAQLRTLLHHYKRELPSWVKWDIMTIKVMRTTLFLAMFHCINGIGENSSLNTNPIKYMIANPSQGWKRLTRPWRRVGLIWAHIHNLHTPTQSIAPNWVTRRGRTCHQPSLLASDPMNGWDFQHWGSSCQPKKVGQSTNAPTKGRVIDGVHNKIQGSYTWGEWVSM